MPRINRRTFVAGAAAALGAGAISVPQFGAQAADGRAARPPRILLRSSWQTVNIGDIGHTPGVLRLLEQHLPDAEIRLWPSKVDNGVDVMLRERFPKLTIVQGTDAVAQAIAECDFMLHSSGPSVVAQKDLARWQRETQKPFGIYGVTIGAVDDALREVLDHAKFVFCRDGVSLELIKSSGIKCPIMEFAPDGAFAVDLRNDAAADKFLGDHDLGPGKFLCVIPRYRYTPYWTIPAKKAAFDQKRHDRNQAMKEHDIAPLRAAVEAVVTQTEMKVLICPEDQTQMALGKEMIYDRLTDEARRRVVWRENYWLTDEALSTYLRSAGLFGLEMHSPIMCIGNGVPAVVGRFAEQTSKGTMWRDIGLSDWLFDFDRDEDIARYVPTVLSLAKDPALAKSKAAAGRTNVERRQRETMAVVRRFATGATA